MLREGIATEADFIDADAIKRSAYYRDFLEPYGLRWFAGLGFSLSGNFYCLAVQRRIDQGPFEQNQLDVLRRLILPLHDAVTMSEKIQADRMGVMLDSLELVAQPAVVCDRHGGVVLLNQSAEKVFGKCIDRVSRQLKFADRKSQDNLDCILKAVQQDDRGPASRTTIIQDDRGYWRSIRAIALTDIARSLHDRAQVLLLMPATGSGPQCSHILQKTFGFTKAEASLALELKSGRSLKAAASVLGITYETARSYLKATLIKAGVHSQIELVALITLIVS